MSGCCVCGDPTFLHVDQRPFCQEHAGDVVVAIEQTVDALRRAHASRLVTRFTTIQDYAKFCNWTKD